ncbi:MAG: 50S ribosomal protein L23 [Planctomycetes bacterium]|nr:50S ribosomal protein L23 [Planctomycetota bacterium]MBI3846669.1 50S ribosomal protein L23 [Planctomycetota bacterium]
MRPTDSHHVIVRPLVTEKGVFDAESKNHYYFKVHRDANKIQIKKAVQELFNVTVLGVNTIVRKGKPGRVGTLGNRKDWKKAIVTLKEGDKIEFI